MNLTLAKRSLDYKGVRGQWYVSSTRHGPILRIWSESIDFPSGIGHWAGPDCYDCPKLSAGARGGINKLKASMDADGYAVFAVDVINADASVANNESRVKKKVGLFVGQFTLDGDALVRVKNIRRITMND